MINFIKKIKYFSSKPTVVEIEEDDFKDITDEIEKSLWEIKDVYDIPTEEVELSISTRRMFKKKKRISLD